jgi:hypothetical protein
MRCSVCEQEASLLVPIPDRSGSALHVCPACAQVFQEEHADELLWNPVTFESLRYGRMREKQPPPDDGTGILLEMPQRGRPTRPLPREKGTPGTLPALVIIDPFIPPIPVERSLQCVES